MNRNSAYEQNVPSYSKKRVPIPKNSNWQQERPAKGKNKHKRGSHFLGVVTRNQMLQLRDKKVGRN